MTPAVAVAGVAGVAPPASVAPPAVPPFERIDLHDIKQQLHDALGEQGLPYWKSLKAYLLGQVGRSELQALVRGWLKPKNVHLHNQFLTALLHNASSPQFGHGPSSPLSMHKRRQGGGDALDFDTDPTFIEPRDRVRNWVMGMGGRERDRVRRSVNNEEDEDGESDKEGGAQEWDGAGVGKKRKWSVYQSSEWMTSRELTQQTPSTRRWRSHRTASRRRTSWVSGCPRSASRTGCIYPQRACARLASLWAWG